MMVIMMMRRRMRMMISTIIIINAGDYVRRAVPNEPEASSRRSLQSARGAPSVGGSPCRLAEKPAHQGPGCLSGRVERIWIWIGGSGDRGIRGSGYRGRYTTYMTSKLYVDLLNLLIIIYG